MRRTQAAFLAVLLTGTLLGTVSPATAADPYVCTYLASPINGSWKIGTIRQTGAYEDILWSFYQNTGCYVYFPSGGSITVSLRFYNKSSSGGCTTTFKSNSSYTPTYTGYNQSHVIATKVLATTCYAVRWRANNSTSAGVNHYGKLLFRNPI
jgi:hypothetical protein